MKSNKKQTPKQGEIYLLKSKDIMPYYVDEKAYVVVVQNNECNKALVSVMVALIFKKSEPVVPLHIPLSDKYGLPKQYEIYPEKIYPVSKIFFKKPVARITDVKTLYQITSAVIELLDGKNAKPRKADIKCLCDTCLKAYKKKKAVICKRAQPTNRRMYRCDLCGSNGYDYIISNKCDLY